jgi:glycosyltransferase involved in cell wall biosynthesis
MPGRVEQKVILLANVDVSLNPYIQLFTQALRGQGLKADVSHKLSSVWHLSAPRTTALHLQYAETLYCVRAPSSWKSKSIRKLMCNRLVSPVRSICRLWFSLLILTVCKLRGAWIVYTVLNLEPHSDKTPDRLLHGIASWSIVKLADRLQVCSEAASDLVKARFKRKNGVVVVPLGNFIDHYPRGISKSEARERLQIAPGLILFLFFGLIRPYKGIEDLIPAFRELGADLCDKRLLIVGAAQDKAYEAHIAAIAGPEDGIKLLPGYVPDEKLQVFLAASDLVVFPYRGAASSAGGLLALSFGRPIIAPSSPAFTHLVTEQTGVLYDPNVTGALTAALRAGAKRTWDEERILEFAHGFDWQRLGPALRALYERTPEKQGLSS